MSRVRSVALVASLAASLIAACALSLSAYGDPPATDGPGGPAPSKPETPAKPDASGGANAAAPKQPPEPTAEEIADWTARLGKIAGGYRGLSRVDDYSRWAPTACRAPFGGSSFPPVPMSAADPKSSDHGGKLYALFAKDVESYGKLSGDWLVPHPDDGKALADATAGLVQVVVKESFEAVEMKPGEKEFLDPDDSKPHSTRRMRAAERDGKRFKPGAPKGLFVMMAFDKKPASSDDGWVYGTVAPDGSVTGVGRLSNCMACHTAAPHGRLFGLARATK